MAFNQPDVLPAAAEAIHRALAAAPGGRLTPATLAQRIVPDQDRAGTKVVGDTLVALRAVGAIVDVDDQVSVRPDATSTDDTGVMRAIILESIIDDAQRPELWATEEQELNLTGALDLVRSLTWMLLLPVSANPWSWEGASSVQQEQADHLTDAVVRNEERWRPFVRWARYLGFASSLGQYALVPDPTAAIFRVLRGQLRGRGFQPITEVVDNLATELPMLDRGWLSLAMQDRYPVRWDSALSPALTFALVRLQNTGHISFDEGRGDAEKVGLADGQGAYHGIRWHSEKDR